MSRYLVSFCNNDAIRLAVLNRSGIERIIDIQNPNIPPIISGVTGLSLSGEQVFVSLQSSPSAILSLDRQFAVTKVRILPELSDLHGLACEANRLLAISTGTNQVCSLPFDLVDAPEVIWQGGTHLGDTLHVNDIHAANNTLFITMFGERPVGAMRSGAIIDLKSGKPMLTGLREPHSPFWWQGSLYVLESATGDLIQIRTGFGPRRVAGFVGYMRGLLVDEHGFVLGQSGYRNTSRSLIGDRRSAPHMMLNTEVNPLTRSGVYFMSNDIGGSIFIDTTSVGTEIFQIISLPDNFSGLQHTESVDDVGSAEGDLGRRQPDASAQGSPTEDCRDSPQ
jgi:hypothetical protein